MPDWTLKTPDAWTDLQRQRAADAVHEALKRSRKGDEVVLLLAEGCEVCRVDSQTDDLLLPPAGWATLENVR